MINRIKITVMIIMKKNRLYTVITGASRGLGKSLAHECAACNRNLILISLPGENINLLATRISVIYNIEVRYFETDLTNDRELNHLCDELSVKFNIDMLINNAGIGGVHDFTNASAAYIDNIILLNIKALVTLTQRLLPVLKKQEKAYILNIASMASFGPMPYKTVYPASKAFVYSFSRSLYAELKDTNVLVSVAHPGGMATNPHVSERINSYNRLIKSTILSPDSVARICIRNVLNGKSIIIPGIMGKLSWVIIKILPTQFLLDVFKKSLLKELKLIHAA
ncbi:MAG: SDR family NAD(P)-dependent oxidoreductase [Prolixibacteraceae bacterium]|nr:SDR family NAD(P)-dependent oxidoreductase [Prolixibacteraceae bacterium]NLO02097.1 SDR family NAD(P)-dependent oxidoreductase [Bacteroidales bacterium]